MDAPKKGIKTYTEKLNREAQDIHNKNLLKARELSKKTTPQIASFLTGVSEDEIKGTSVKKPEKLSRPLKDLSKKEIQEMIDAKEKDKKVRRKKANKPNIFLRIAFSTRDFIFPNAAEEAKEKKRLTGREHREAMREKYGIKK